jgi:ribosomal RNA-processing protein 8
MAIAWLKSRPHNWQVADLGCGDATLASAVPQKVHSFDLVSTVPGVIACNMSNLPLQKESIDVAVFCLSLMGTDYGEFLEEAARVLNQSGWIWIAEVQSRFVEASGRSILKEFIAAVTQLGFTLKKQDVSNSHFLLLQFQGRKGRMPGPYLLQWPGLRACQYKKR